MYNNPLGKKPSPRSSHRKIITFISKLCRSPAAGPWQPPAPHPALRAPACASARGCARGACVLVRVWGASGRRGEAKEGRSGGSCGCINLFNQKTQTHTRTQKEALSADLGGGEEPPPCPALGGGEQGQWRGRDTPIFEKDGWESLRLTSFIY